MAPDPSGGTARGPLIVSAFVAVLASSGCTIPVGIARYPDGATDAGVLAIEAGILDPACVERNLDSVVLCVPEVAGALDYRAFAAGPGVEVTLDADGRETVHGATIFCAGHRQHAAPAPPDPEVVREIEVVGVTERRTIVVEAIDRRCPFPGLFGAVDDAIPISANLLGAFPDLVNPTLVSSEATIRARHGSMIFNGQGPASDPGGAAAPDPPVVLARWTVEVEPLASAPVRDGATFFAGFESDQAPVMRAGELPDGRFHEPPGRGYAVAVYQTNQFDFYATNTEFLPSTHFFFDRGRLHMLTADQSQDVSAALAAVPRATAQLPATDGAYLRVSFETTGNSTNRRFFWVGVCGPETAGSTFAADGLLTDYLSFTADFFSDGSTNPSTGGWNCLFLAPHDGLAAPVPAGGTNPESSVIVAIHRANAPAGASAVNVSPPQLGDPYPPAWYRQQRAGVVTDLPILDDVLDLARRTRFDVYVSRQRVVLYVDGSPRLCNDFGPEALTMAEAAVVFGDLLNGSGAEHGELMEPFADRTGQRHYLDNTIVANERTWDNLAFAENVALPAGFVAADCHVYTP